MLVGKHTIAKINRIYRISFMVISGEKYKGAKGHREALHAEVLKF